MSKRAKPMTAPQRRWMEVYEAALLMSDNDSPSSVKVADAAEGTERPEEVSLMGKGMTLYSKDGVVQVGLTEGVDIDALFKIIDRLY
ncbi:MAG TPA: hypothetical protein VF077_10340 [Nitrospiraceae bacterium]